MPSPVIPQRRRSQLQSQCRWDSPTLTTCHLATVARPTRCSMIGYASLPSRSTVDENRRCQRPGVGRHRRRSQQVARWYRRSRPTQRRPCHRSRRCGPARNAYGSDASLVSAPPLGAYGADPPCVSDCLDEIHSTKGATKIARAMTASGRHQSYCTTAHTPVPKHGSTE